MLEPAPWNEAILCGGLRGHNFRIEHWPEEETLAKIITESFHGGCPGHNMSSALKRLGAPFPVEGMGLLGDDADGRFLLKICDELGIERSALEIRPVKIAIFAMTHSHRQAHIFIPGSLRGANPYDFV
jgi:sugar/nucleoside kinase (ribokinase family)